MPVKIISKNSLAAKAAEIEAKLDNNLEDVLQALFPNGSHSGSDFRIGDVLGKAGESLSISLEGDKRGLWQDFATGEGGTPLQLIALHYGLDLKIQRPSVLEKAGKLLEAVANLPAKDALPGPTKITHAKEVAQWDYLAADGAYLWTIKRLEDAVGEKSIRPFNKHTGKCEAHPKPRPLYNLPGIGTSALVIIVEGEKCAQALIDEGHCATTAMMGAMAPAHLTDWSPFQGKDVLIWPDHDEPGKKYAMNCAEAALEAGASSCAVLLVPEEQPKGWDAADALAGSTFDVEGFLKNGERQWVLLPNTLELMAAFEDGDATSEDGIARVLTERYAGKWKYCAPWGRWYCWDDKRWVHDQVLAFSYLARQVCRAASTLARQGSRARIASAATVANVERLARADPAHATAVEQWDAEPLLLNTSGGIVDLRTGQLSAHDRSRLLTKSTTARPQGTCPQWLNFLKVITDDNQKFVDYLQRVAGYCLTGLTTEHALFFLYGTGANGKSVFLNVLSAILGDYAKTAPMDTFMDTRSDRHPTDLAGLRGARLVCAVETEQGRRWSESKCYVRP